MPKYFFHIEGSIEYIDTVGTELAGVELMRRTATRTAAEFLRDVNGGAKAGQCGGVKPGPRLGCDADMEMAPIGAISMSTALISIRVSISPVSGSTVWVAWFFSAPDDATTRRRAADCFSR